MKRIHKGDDKERKETERKSKRKKERIENM